MSNAPPIIVVGAGISGLCASLLLRDAGVPVRVLEKSRGYGGRLATRRIGEQAWDTGAQAISARGSWFADLLSEAADAGVARRVGEQHWVGIPGMTAIARWIARDAEVELEVRVTAVGTKRTGPPEPAAAPIIVQTESGDEFPASGVILTAPLPQSLELLARGEFALGEAAVQLAERSYDPCLVLLARSERLPASSRTRESNQVPGLFRCDGSPFRLLSEHGLRRDRQASGIWSCILRSEDSRELYDLTDDQLTRFLADSLNEILPEAEVVSVKRWRYSEPAGQSERSEPHPSLPAAVAPVEGLPLILCGDGLAGGRVESAAESGRAAAALVRELVDAGTVGA